MGCKSISQNYLSLKTIEVIQYDLHVFISQLKNVITF